MKPMKRLIKMLLFKIKYRKTVSFDYSNNIGYNSYFEGNNKLGRNSFFSGLMGFASYMGDNCFFLGKIGRYTSIGPRCKVIIGSHPYTYPFVTTCPAFYSKKKQCGSCFSDSELINTMRFADVNNIYPVIIGNDCWVNSDVRIVAGVNIGDGAILLAGSVVTKDVPPFAIVGGVPAKVLKYRYKDEDIQFILESKWWNIQPELLAKNWKALSNFDNFRKFIENENITYNN